ncbi:MAG: Wzz/FepE/Etk N-terminal domain-containing protein, partial [bacterium]
MELRQYLDVLRRHKWFIIEAVVVVAIVAGALSSAKTPLYKATASVLLTPLDNTQQLNPTAANPAAADQDRYVTGQINIIQSRSVADGATKSLSGVTTNKITSALSVSQVSASNVVKIAATDADRNQARDIANAVAKAYSDNRRLSAIAGLQSAADDIQAKLGPLQAQIAAYDAQIGDGSTIPGASSTLVSPVKPGSTTAPTQPAPQVPGDTGSLGGASSTQEALKAARYAAAVQYETLFARQQELVTDVSLQRGDAELIAQADTPLTPVSPHPKRDAALGGILGLLLAGGISLLREQLDDRVRSVEEIERLTGLPVLARLPFDDETAKGSPGITAMAQPTSPLSEA